MSGMWHVSLVLQKPALIQPKTSLGKILNRRHFNVTVGDRLPITVMKVSGGAKLDCVIRLANLMNHVWKFVVITLKIAILDG